MAYDTTLHDRLGSIPPSFSLHDGYIADWKSRYFPQTSLGMLTAMLGMCGVFLLAGLAPIGSTTLWRELQHNVLIHGIYRFGGWDGLLALRAISLALLAGGSMWAASRRGIDLITCTLTALVALLPALAMAGDPRSALLFAPLLPLGLLATDALAERRNVLFGICLSLVAASFAFACGWLPTHGIAITPLALTSPAGLLFIVSWIPIVLTFRWSPRTVTYREAVLLAVAAAAALFLAEGLLVWATLAPWVLAPHAAVAFRSYPYKRPLQETDQPNSTRTLIAMALVFTAILVNPATSHLVLGSPREEGRLVAAHTPLALADEIERRELAGICLASPGWGEYLAWHSGGQLASPAISAEETRHVAAGGAWWLTIVDQKEIDYLALDRRTWPVLARVAAESPRGEVLYQDEHSLLVRILPAAQ